MASEVELINMVTVSSVSFVSSAFWCVTSSIVLKSFTSQSRHKRVNAVFRTLWWDARTEHYHTLTLIHFFPFGGRPFLIIVLISVRHFHLVLVPIRQELVLLNLLDFLQSNALHYIQRPRSSYRILFFASHVLDKHKLVLYFLSFLLRTFVPAFS